MSSTLQERYGITEENAIGEVLWHSLNESGEVGIYDMKFGDTIIRNLTEADLVEAHGAPHKRDKEHGEQDEKDPKRRKRSNDEEANENVASKGMSKNMKNSFDKGRGKIRKKAKL